MNNYDQLISFIESHKPFKETASASFLFHAYYKISEDQILLKTSRKGNILLLAIGYFASNEKEYNSVAHFENGEPLIPSRFIIHSTMNPALYYEKASFFLNGNETSEQEVKKRSIRNKMNQSF